MAARTPRARRQAAPRADGAYDGPMPVDAAVSFPAPSLLAAVAPDAVDVAVGVVLLFFALWGAMRGVVRELVGVVVLAAAFGVASAVSPRIAPNVAKVATLSPEGTAGVAYLTAFVGTVILCAVLLHWVRSGLDRPHRGGATSRLLGAVLGVVQGAAVLALVLYAVLAAHLDGAAPTSPPASDSVPLVRAIRESRAARAIVDVEPRLRGALLLPERVAKRVDAVNESIAGAR